MKFIIYYRRPFYNQHRSYPRNYNRFVGCTVAEDESGLHAALEEIAAKGYPVISVYKETGAKVKI